MEFLTQQNKRNAGDDELRAAPRSSLIATGKNVIVIGGGDTGSDCVGTSIRQGAKSVTQIEIMPKPPEKEARRCPGRTGRSSCAPRRATRKVSIATGRS